MISFLDTKLSKVELESNLKLFPTYSYWRYYIFGATLKQHTDRTACEISVTACVKKYDNWPIVVEGKSFELEEGDAILYLGNKQKHGRPGTYKGEGMAQVFLHYVNQNGPNKNHAYDIEKKMKEKTVHINNFIGVYDNYITKEECSKAIKFYEDQNKFNKTINRLHFEKSPILQKQDQQ